MTTESCYRTHVSVPEFIHLISSEANEICEQESKKTIAPEHIIGALRVRFANIESEFTVRLLVASRI